MSRTKSCKDRCLLEGGSVVFVNREQCASNAVADCACLTGHTAALDVGNDVKFALGARNAERLVDDELQRIKTEILVDVTVVDRDRTAAGINAYTCNGLLSSAGSVEIRLCAFVHNSLSVLSLS